MAPELSKLKQQIILKNAVSNYINEKTREFSKEPTQIVNGYLFKYLKSYASEKCN